MSYYDELAYFLAKYLCTELEGEVLHRANMTMVEARISVFLKKRAEELDKG